MNVFFQFIKFWYPESILFFIRLYKNTIAYLEEDLAVGLMWKLLFVPLYHDKSYFGRIISFFFRIFRIIFGLFAFALVTLFFCVFALIWFFLPIILPISYSVSLYTFGTASVLAFTGIVIFIIHFVKKPKLSVWHIQTLSEIWQSTTLLEEDIIYQKLLSLDEVKQFINSLELSEDFLNSLGSDEFTQFRKEHFRDILEKAWQLSKTSQAKYITASYFWVAIVATSPNIDQILIKYSLSKADFEEALSYFELKRNKMRHVYLWDEEYAIKHLQGVNRGWLGAPTPTLDSVSTDLTKLASQKSLTEFIGREAVVNQVVHILSQSKDKNVLLVGEPGSGRTTLVNSLAKLIVDGNAPDALATKRVISLDLTKLLSGVTTEGELAEKIKITFEEVQYVEDIIIYVDELHTLGMGEAGNQFNLYSLLLPYLESDSFQFIGSTDSGNYAKILEKNGSFARIFHKVEVVPANEAETIRILEEQGCSLISLKSIDLSYKAIKELVILAKKYIHDRVLPDSALSILTECETAATSKNQSKFIEKQITSEIVKQVFQQRIQIPVVELDVKQKEDLLNLEEIIHQKMIGQEQAVKVVADTLRRSSTALREENRPIGSFLFVGPTGVGKTELSKILAESYFKNAGAFVRFDMSEYQTEQSIDRLIGTDAMPGELTESIRQKPYALILLDEFEKANPKILTLFLQVLEDGRLTDYQGKTTDFTNTIIIATSNAASVTIAQGLKNGQSSTDLQETVKNELLKIFKPELVNRFDEVVIFTPLTEIELEKIVNLKLKVLQNQLKEQGYIIEFTPEVISEIAKKGFDPVLGARPMRRLVQDTLEAQLSKMILSNKIAKGIPISVTKELLK